MNYLIYISTSVRLFDDYDLEEMLLQSRKTNADAGITGVLLYNKGTFFQVIEGEEQEVNATFKKIQADPRHHNIIKMKSGSLNKRNFSDWSMGFTASLSQNVANLPGFINPCKKDFLYQFTSSHPAVSLLKSFATINNFAF